MENTNHYGEMAAGQTGASTPLYVETNAGEDILRFLEIQLSNILSQPPVRPWYFWESHNPWGMSAPVVDSWGFLDICQNDLLTDLAAQFIGNDIILYDSQFYPDPTTYRHRESDGWQCDAIICPTSPQTGVVIRIVLTDMRDQTATLQLSNPGLNSSTDEITLGKGSVIAHDIHTCYRYSDNADVKTPLEYLIRYFPTTSVYLRQQHSDFHRQMNILYPLQNFAIKPLWLVRGEDRAGNDFVTGFKARTGQWVPGKWGME